LASAEPENRIPDPSLVSVVLRSVVVAVLFAVSACGRPGLSADDAASLIKRYRTTHCRVVETSIPPGDAALPARPDTVAALLRGAHFDRSVKTVVESSAGNVRTERLTFRGDDAAQSAELTETRSLNPPQGDRIVLRACMFVPTQIDVSDIVLESSTAANVLFTEHLGLSLLGTNFTRARLLARMTGMAPSEAHAFHLRLATLNFDEREHRWVVTSVGPGG
jgi:hypothetical protein